MLSNKALVILLYTSLASYRCVFSMEDPVITRATYDLLHYPNCNGKKANNFECDGHSERFGDKRTCQCKCKNGYVVYRDPAVEFVNGKNVYQSKVGSKECVWYGIYREGCHFLKRRDTLLVGESPFPAPTVLDLTSSGNITLEEQDEVKHKGRLCIQPYVRQPGKNEWKQIDDIKFNLTPNSQRNMYKLSWTLKGNADIYAYQGLVMKLNFSECDKTQADVYCMMAKVAGTYAGDKNCQRRTVSGRCCIFPFVHNNVVHKSCIKTEDMPEGPWCAVSLNTSVENGKHVWRDLCSVTSTTPSSQINRPSYRRPPTIYTPSLGSERRKTTPKHISTKPHRAKTEKPRPEGIITVTVTHNTCSQSAKIPPTPNFGANGSDGGTSAGLVIGILFGILAFLLILALFALFIRRRKTTSKKKLRPKKTISREDLAESPYASVYSSTTTTGITRNMVNHGYQQSIELTEDQAAAVVRRSYLRDSVKSSGGSHFYDSIENKSRASTGLSSPVYSMPEADYSLIIEQRQTKIDNGLPPVLPVMLSGPRKNPTKHLYSVLERDHDPLQHPEAIDNDTAFVEANPLYGTTTRYRVEMIKPNSEGGYAEANPLYGTTTRFNRRNPPPLPPRPYDNPKEISPPKVQSPEPVEKDI